MIVPSDGKRIAIALVAAIVFVLQSLGAAWTKDVPFPLDAFGNALCINDEVADGAHHRSGEHPGFGKCCAVVCSGCMSSSLLSQDVLLQPIIFPLLSKPRDKACAASISHRADEKQGNPRAPPVLI